jgi:hypothetical protein
MKSLRATLNIGAVIQVEQGDPGDLRQALDVYSLTEDRSLRTPESLADIDLDPLAMTEGIAFSGEIKSPDSMLRVDLHKLENHRGEAVFFSQVKLIVIRNDSESHDLTVSASKSGGWSEWLVGGEVRIFPGEFLVASAAKSGWVVADKASSLDFNTAWKVSGRKDAYHDANAKLPFSVLIAGISQGA